METATRSVDALLSVRERFTLKGKRAIVTGGAGGIGRATAAAFADLGADVAIADIAPRRRDAEEVAEQIASRYGVTAIALTADVTDEDSVVAMVNETRSALGGLEVVHSNAGIVSTSDSPDQTLADWDRIIRINLTSMFLVNRTAANAMKEDGVAGSIINTASMSGTIINQVPDGVRHAVGYTTSKAGVKHLTKGMAVDYAPFGIRVNSVSPGVMISGIHDGFLHESGMTYEQLNATAKGSVPLGRYGTMDEIGGIVAFLATDLASFITGADILIDGATTVW